MNQMTPVIPYEEVPEVLKVIRTPLILPAWEKGLRGHPDPTYRGYLLDGLE